MGKYQIRAKVYRGNLGAVREQISHALEVNGLSEKVAAHYSSFKISEYGVNPVADSDSRSFMELIASDGEVLFPPKSDIHSRTSMRDLPFWIGFAINKINQAEISKLANTS